MSNKKVRRKAPRRTLPPGAKAAPKRKASSNVVIHNTSTQPVLTVSNGGSMTLSGANISSQQVYFNTDLTVEGEMIVVGTLTVEGAIKITPPEEPLSPKDALRTTNAILATERTARIQAKLKPALIENLEALKYDKKWLQIQEDPERAQLEIENKINQLKGISLGDLLEDLSGDDKIGDNH